MPKIDLEIDRDELFGSIGIYSACKSLDDLLDNMLLLSTRHPEVINIMKRIVLIRASLNESLCKLDLLQDYTQQLEKALNINQEPPEPYCHDCGRGES